MPIPVLAIASAVASAAGAIGSAAKNKKARQEEKRAYDRAQAYLNSDYYRSPLESVGNKALLKTMDYRLDKNNEAIDNRAAAGGATVENVLAAKQNNNEAISNTYARLLQSEEARQQGIRAQQMGLDQQHSQAVQNGYLADAANWQNWGQTTANAIMSLGTSSMLGGSTPLIKGSSAPAVQPAVQHEWGKIYEPQLTNDTSSLYYIPKPGAITV